MIRTILAAAVLLFAALPAAAADLATIDCVGQKLDAAARAKVEADAARNLDETGKRPSYDPAVSAGLRTAAAACAKEHKWSAAAAKAAASYALAKIGLPTAQRVIGERGFDSAALEDRFQGLAEDKRNRPLSAADAQALVIASVTEEAQQTRENAELLGEYFMFLSTLQYAAFDFAQA